MVLFAGTARHEIEERPYLFTLHLPDEEGTSTQVLAVTRNEGDEAALNLRDAPRAPIDEGAEALLDEVIRRTTADVERYPNDPRLATALGVALQNAGRVDHALEVLARTLELNPESNYTRFELAYTLLMADRPADADELFREVSDAGGQLGYRALVGEAQAALRMGKPENSVKATESALGLRNSPFAHFLLGLALLGDPEKWNSAIHHMRVATQMAPRRAEFHHGLGVALAMRGENPRATAEFKHALTLRPTMHDALEALARVMVEGGNAEGAVDYLTRFNSQYPRDPLAHELLALALLEAGRPGPARTELFAALKLTSDAPRPDRVAVARIANNLGVSYWRVGSVGEAERLFRRALEDEGLSTAPARNLGALLLERQRFPQAQRVLEAAITADPDDSEARKLLAQCQAAQGHYAEAVTEIRRVLAARPDAETYAVLGALLIDGAQRPEEATQVLMEGIAKYPSDAMINNNLAYSYLMIGAVDEATEVLQRIPPEEGPAAPFVTATRGLLRLREGDVAGGDSLYRAAAELARNSGRVSLADEVDQKRHLELAKAWLATGKLDLAGKEIQLGLRLQGRSSFRRDLLELSRSSAILGRRHQA